MSLQNRIKESIKLIKMQPLNRNLRLELLQLYCLNGQWDSALKLIQQFLKLNSRDTQTKALFLGNIECEIYREKVFEGLILPQVFLDENLSNLQLQQDILKAFQQKNPEQLTTLFLKKCENLPVFKVKTSDHKEITGEILDTDCRLAFVIEIFEHNQYYWLDIKDIQEIRFQQAEFLTDIIWRRGNVILKNQKHLACFFPVRYPFGDHELEDQLKYSKLTEWNSFGALTIGLGQKTYSNADVDLSILDIESIQVSYI